MKKNHQTCSFHPLFLPLILQIILLTACASKPYRPKDYYQFQNKTEIPISITKFTNKAAQTYAAGQCRDWWWFSSTLGDAFHDLAIAEFSNYENLQILERNSIDKIYDHEVNLLNSEKEKPIEKGHFKKARYTLIGVVNSFEYCASNLGMNALASLSESILGAGVRKETSTVEVTLRLVETKTGVVLATASGKGEQSRNNISASGVLNSSFKLKGDAFQQSSLSDAIREAIHLGTTELFKKAKL